MLQIVYISTTRKVLSGGELDDILDISRRNNDAAGVTGLLVAGGSRFLQALEGPTQAVLTTFNRICRDPRHFAVVELANRLVDARAFGDWSMAYQAGGDVATGASLAEAVERLTAPLEQANLRAEFRGFATLHG